MSKKGSILVINDEGITRDIFERTLTGAGYQVFLAKTGEDAIESYQQTHFDVE